MQQRTARVWISQRRYVGILPQPRQIRPSQILRLSKRTLSFLSLDDSDEFGMRGAKGHGEGIKSLI
jgi:hypothetical protein